MNQLNRIDSQLIELGCEIGKGGFGKVCIAILNNDEKIGTVVAIKFFNSESDFRNEAQEHFQLNEQISHDNILKLYGQTIIDTKNCLVLEYADGGCLQNFLTKNDYTMRKALNWLLQISDGMHYLHILNKLHRDLKPLNILLVGANHQIKICDFGMVRDKTSYMSLNRGTARWMAPEVISDTTGNGRYTQKCDLFSFGISMWQVLARKELPFIRYTFNMDVLSAIRRGERPEPIPENLSDKLRNLMVKCWHQEPNKRPTMGNVFQELNTILLETTIQELNRIVA